MLFIIQFLVLKNKFLIAKFFFSGFNSSMLTINSNKYFLLQNNSTSQNPIFGRQPRFYPIMTKPLEQEKFVKIKNLAQIYDKLHNFVNNLSVFSQKTFKGMYPGLVEGKTRRGFAFKNILPDNKRLQIARFNTYSGSDELITFGITDQDNKTLIRYKINNDGSCQVLGNKGTRKNVGLYDNFEYLDKSLEELKTLEAYADNYWEFNHSFKTVPSNITTEELVQKIVARQLRKGPLVVKFYPFKEHPLEPEKFNKIKEIADICNEVCSFPMKIWESFSASDLHSGIVERKLSGGFIFDNILPDGKRLQAARFNTQPGSDELITFGILDGNGTLIRYKIANDGKCCIMANTSTRKNAGLYGDFDYLDLTLDKFKILKSYLESVTASKQEVQAQKRLERELRKKEKLEKKLNKAEKPKKARKIERVPSKPIKVKSASVKQAVKPKRSKPAIFAPHPLSLEEKMKRYAAWNLLSTASKMDDLFKKPVEARSPHLIHERLTNGNIFSGRFSLKTSDGALITVSKVKSPRYAEFTYYSIKINKDNQEYVVNLDPKNGRIVKSSPSGKVIINDNQEIKYVTKSDLVKAYPDAINLPEYLDEIFDYKANAKRTIKRSDLKLQKRAEENILNELKKKDDFFDLDFLA